MPQDIDIKRRRVWQSSLTLLGLAVIGTTDAIGDDSLTTPQQPRGPFYPAQLPLDKDNDLVTVEGRSGRARGEITHIIGQVLDRTGQPIPQARVEIWQCDAYGRYHHPWDRRDTTLDANFQGYGQFVTGAEGGYRFRTIRPVPYPGRAPHIHFAVSAPGIDPLVTQMYIRGNPENQRDWLLNSIANPQSRASLLVDLTRSNNAVKAWVGRFDIVLNTG